MKNPARAYTLIFLLILFPCSAACAFDLIESNVPELDYAHTAVDRETERVLGQLIMQKIYGSDRFMQDQVIQEYLKKFSNEFSSPQDPLDERPRFFGFESDELNAFAFFGAHVAVHGGLILSVSNESELAAVLAHETAHIKQRHLSRMLQNNQKMMPLTMAELLAAAVIGSTVSPDAGVHLATAAIAGHSQQLINFTREHEQEADRIGIQLLAKAHYDPHAMATVFECMKNKAYYQKAPPEYLLTHPLFDSRIADAQNRAHAFKDTTHKDSLLFQLVRARLEVAKHENSHKKVKRLQDRLTRETFDSLSAAQYAYALALINDHQTQTALPILESLAHTHPDSWLLSLSLLEAKAQHIPLQETLEQSTRLLQRYPENEAILLKHLDWLLANKEPQVVIRKLFPYQKDPHTNPVMYQLLAKAYSQLSKKTEVHRAQAEWHFGRAEFKEALAQLDFARDYAETHQQTDALELIAQRKESMEALIEQEAKL
jgi:beta-barrel assembly-enhancing protease